MDVLEIVITGFLTAKFESNSKMELYCGNNKELWQVCKAKMLQKKIPYTVKYNTSVLEQEYGIVDFISPNGCKLTIIVFGIFLSELKELV
jgi:hypothetical protein